MPRSANSSIPKPPSLPEVGFVRLPTILAVFPVGRSSWWAGIKAGRYPSPVKLGPRVSAWRVEQIRDLLVTHASKDGV
jgi:prophage regulatory protein